MNHSDKYLEREREIKKERCRPTKETEIHLVKTWLADVSGSEKKAVKVGCFFF